MTVEATTQAALASGVPLILLGALLLALRPPRRQQVFFALFSLAWGIQVVLANLSRLTDDEVLVRRLVLASYVLLPAIYFFLARFLAVSLRRPRLATALTGAAGAVGLVALGLLWAWPEGFLERLVVVDGGYRAVQGPAFVWLAGLPFQLVLYASLLWFGHAWRVAVPGSERHRARGFFAAFVLFNAYFLTENLLFYLRFGAGGADSGLLVLFLAGVVLLAAQATWSIVRPPPPGQRDWWLLAAFVAPALVAGAEHVVPGAPEQATLGLWRLLFVAVLVHTLARHQLFDVDLKLQWTIRQATVAGAVVATFLLTDMAAGRLGAGGSSSWYAAGAAFLMLLGFEPIQRLAGRLARAAVPVPETADYLLQRKREVYLGALEAVAAGGMVPQREQRFLARVQEQLELSAPEVVRLEAMAGVTRPTTRPEPDAAPDLPLVEPGALLAGRFRVERFLGQGAHGRTYTAWDLNGERRVAVKVVGTLVYGGRAAEAIIREARIISRLDHPHVIRVLEVLEGRREAALVMAYASGGNVQALLQRRGRLGLLEAAEIIDQVLAALEAAHAAGVVHRDVKPENLLLDGADVLLADFGIARETGPEATGMDGGALGTLLYMSPEQVRGSSVDGRSDLYAAAAVFYQLATGRFYLRVVGRDDYQVRTAILEEPPDLDGLPAWATAFCRQALAKAPEERFADASAMRQALAAGMGWR
ncbi:MAG: serine/threonine-protein kinase [Thermoplasmatota archaeon]